MMELDKLEKAWQSMGARLDAQALELREFRRVGIVDAARSRLRLMTAGQWAQLAIGLLIVSWAGGYWWDHMDQPHLVVYGVGVHLYGIALVVVSALQLTQLLRIDYRKPVLEVQRALVALRRLRVRSERALLVLGFVAWVPLLFIALRALGIDVWLRSPANVLSNLGVGIVLAGLVFWLTHRFRDRFERDATGRSLREAEAELAALGA
jgi:hypothetical protein